MSKPWYLYVITNTVNGKQYVGITTRPEKRWQQHRAGAGSCLVHRAYKKYGKQLHFAVWYRAPEDKIKAMECKLIVALRTKVPNGYNIEDGGEGHYGRPVSEETRRKMSLAAARVCQRLSEEAKQKRAHKGSTRSEETRQRMSAAQYGRQVSVKTRQRLSNVHSGKVISGVTRQRMSQARLGRPRKTRVRVDGVECESFKVASQVLRINSATLQYRFRKWHRQGNFPDGFGYVTDLGACRTGSSNNDLKET
jgi:group I intron endonuclease